MILNQTFYFYLEKVTFCTTKLCFCVICLWFVIFVPQVNEYKLFFYFSAECSLYLCLPDICTLQMLAHQVVVPHYNRCFVFALITISVMMSVLLSLIDPALLCSDFLLFFLLFLLSKHSEDIVVDFIKSVSGSSTNQDLKTKVHWMWPVRNAAPLLMGFFRVPVVNKRGWCTARDVEVSVSNTELQESFQQSGKS